jgi:hypothetical protein
MNGSIKRRAGNILIFIALMIVFGCRTADKRNFQQRLSGPEIWNEYLLRAGWDDRIKQIKTVSFSRDILDADRKVMFKTETKIIIPNKIYLKEIYSKPQYFELVRVVNDSIAKKKFSDSYEILSEEEFAILKQSGWFFGDYYINELGYKLVTSSDTLINRIPFYVLNWYCEERDVSYICYINMKTFRLKQYDVKAEGVYMRFYVLKTATINGLRLASFIKVVHNTGDIHYEKYKKYKFNSYIDESIFE